jgi:hypothetical protein
LKGKRRQFICGTQELGTSKAQAIKIIQFLKPFQQSSLYGLEEVLRIGGSTEDMCEQTLGFGQVQWPSMMKKKKFPPWAYYSNSLLRKMFS